MKAPEIRAAWLLCAVCALLWRAAFALPQPPLFERVALAPFVIEPQPFEGAPRRADETKLLQKLSEAATARAERNLVRRRIAGVVERVATGQAPAGVLLSGTIRLPVSLPRKIRGARAEWRKGRFATATIALTDAQGRTLAREEIALDWGDVRWTRSKRIRRHSHEVARALDDVLLDFVWRVADDGVKQLAEGR